MSGFENLRYFVVGWGDVKDVGKEDFSVFHSSKDYVKYAGDYIYREDYFVLNKLSYRFGKNINDFEKRINLNSKGRLYRIDMDDFGLNFFPMDVLNFNYLEDINLSFNNIRAIPKQIEKLENLVSIFVESSNLVEIPDEILKLEKLEYALFEGNILNKKSRRVLEKLVDFDVDVFY